MKRNTIAVIGLLAVSALGMTSCDNDDMPADNFDTSGTYSQNDQMARPAINTVFVGAARKDEFNTTVPTAMNAAFNAQFQSVLTGYGYTQNALGQDKATFAGLLVTDVLNVKMTGTTTFFDGTNVLTGRALADDVIDTELLLIFGGAAGTANPGLTKDNVNANDKAFLSSFPYLATPH
ncbi:MAG TPA: DUF4331 family protein [Chitinophagaceae bacterium]|jgi:hypothetical protein|nr:DUF4331 family protein [Chitinophagaceae bacterium]